MRILFTGATPWTNSGYGKPLRYIIPMLAERGHKIAVAAFAGYRGPVQQVALGNAEFTLFGTAKDNFFNDSIEFDAQSFGADVVITLQDVWTLKDWGKKNFPWLPWMPVDTHPVSKPILDAIEGAKMPLVWCDWAQHELESAGVDSRVVPLGYDPHVYRPVHLDEARFNAETDAARERAGFGKQRFIAGMVAANSSYPSRKSFPEVLQAWKQWVDDGFYGVLYLHTTVEAKRDPHGVDLPVILDSLELPWSTLEDPDEERKAEARVLFPNQYGMWRNAYDDEKLADLYRSMDVLLAPSTAEGFGIPIIEAQACGVPVITLNVTSMPELTFNGQCLEPVQMQWDYEGGWRGVAGVQDIADALYGVYMLDAQTVIDNAAYGCERVRPYTWENIVETAMQPVLEELVGTF